MWFILNTEIFKSRPTWDFVVSTLVWVTKGVSSALNKIWTGKTYGQCSERKSQNTCLTLRPVKL